MPITFEQDVPAKQWLSFIPTAAAKRGVRRRRLFPIAGVTIAALGLAAFSLGTNAEAEPPVESVADAVAEAEPSELPEPTESTAAAQTNTDATAEPTPATDAAPDPVLAAAVPPTPAVEASEADAAPPKPVRKVVEPKPLSERQLRRAKKAARALRGAIDDGSIATAKYSFVATINGEDDVWTAAVDACGSLQAGGIGGWRLPSRLELRDLRRSSTLRADAYWTRHRVAGSDDGSGVAFSTRTGRTGAWMATETAAIVCVQPRPR